LLRYFSEQSVIPDKKATNPSLFCLHIRKGTSENPKESLSKYQSGGVHSNIRGDSLFENQPSMIIYLSPKILSLALPSVDVSSGLSLVF